MTRELSRRRYEKKISECYPKPERRSRAGDLSCMGFGKQSECYREREGVI